MRGTTTVKTLKKDAGKLPRAVTADENLSTMTTEIFRPISREHRGWATLDASWEIFD